MATTSIEPEQHLRELLEPVRRWNVEHVAAMSSSRKKEVATRLHSTSISCSTFHFSHASTPSTTQASHDFFEFRYLEGNFSGIQQQRYMAGRAAVLSSQQISPRSSCLYTFSSISLSALTSSSAHRPIILGIQLDNPILVARFLASKQPYSPGRRHNAFH